MRENINQVISGKGRYSKTSTISTIKDDLDDTIHDEKLIADRLNKYFVEVGPNLSNNLPPGCRDFSEYLEPIDCVFNFSNITEDAVSRKILKHITIYPLRN